MVPTKAAILHRDQYRLPAERGLRIAGHIHVHDIVALEIHLTGTVSAFEHNHVTRRQPSNASCAALKIRFEAYIFVNSHIAHGLACDACAPVSGLGFSKSDSSAFPVPRGKPAP
jgi:hypothetical protein